MKLFTLIFALSVVITGCSVAPQQPARLFTNGYANASSSPAFEIDKTTPVARKTNSATVVSEHANLRQSANQKSDVIDVVPVDSSVEVIKQRGAWFLVKTETAQGWLHGNTIRLEKFDKTPQPIQRVSAQPVTKTVQREAPIESHSGASAKCRDGSLSFSAHRRGTCSHHGGVAEWY